MANPIGRARAMANAQRLLSLLISPPDLQPAPSASPVLVCRRENFTALGAFVESTAGALTARVREALGSAALLPAAEADAAVPPPMALPAPAPAPAGAPPHRRALDLNRLLFGGLAALPLAVPARAPDGFLSAERPLSLAERLLAALLPEGGGRCGRPRPTWGGRTTRACARSSRRSAWAGIRSGRRSRPRGWPRNWRALEDSERIAAENGERRRLREECSERAEELAEYNRAAGAMHAVEARFGAFLAGAAMPAPPPREEGRPGGG